MAAANDNVKKSLAESVLSPKRLGMPSEFALLVTSIIENSYLNGEVIRLGEFLTLTLSYVDLA